MLVSLLVSAALYLPWLSAAPIHGTLEANRLISAREMLRRADWVLPTINGEIYLKKPPFQYWLIEGISALSGSSVLTAGRLVSALSVVGLAALVAWFGSRTVSARVGLTAGLSVPLAGIVLEKGVLAELETVLAFVTAVALAGCYWAIVAERRRMLALLIGGLALGAALLTKGPVPLIALLAAGLPLLVVARGKRARAAAVLVSLLLVGALSAAPWAIAVIQRIGWDEASALLEGEAFKRVQTAGATNRAPWWFYAPGLLAALGPLSLLLPFLQALPARARAEPAPTRTRLVFLLGWALGSVCLLSFSQGKEVRYLISCLPAWILLLAEGLEAVFVSSGWQSYRRFLRSVLEAASWCAPGLALVAGATLSGPASSVAFVSAGLLLGARLLVSLALGSDRSTALVAGILLGGLGFKLLWARAFLPESDARRSVLELGRSVAASVPADQPLVMHEYDAPIHLAVDRPIRIVPDLAQLEPGSGAFALTDTSTALGPEWLELESFQLGERRWRLLRRVASAPMRE